MLKNKDNSKHYKWGNDCDGWHLVETDTLSIIQEIMPANTCEKLHYHNHAQQFFFIVQGTAIFEVDDNLFEVSEGQGFHISPKSKHRIINKTEYPIEFIVTSEPKSHGDRVDL